MISSASDTTSQCSITTLKDVRTPRAGEKITGSQLQCDVDWTEVPLSWKRMGFKRIRAQLRKLVRTKEDKNKGL